MIEGEATVRQRGPVARCSLAVLVTAALAAPAMTGCGSRSTGLVRREVVVRFQTGATPADADRVRATCGNLGPHVKALPSRGNSAIDRRYPVRFDTTGANDGERAQLYACLHKDPSVYGVSEGEV